MSYLTQVQRGIDYIEEHLDVELDAADIARVAGLSQWHFQRIFKALTNETLKTYIRSRRLANALDKLATTNLGVLAIALDAGFESQASFTRVFKEAFGVTPARYRRDRRRFPFPRKVRFDAEYLAHLHANVSLEPVFEERAEARYIGLRTRFFSVDSERNNIAEKLPPLWGAFLARLGEVTDLVTRQGYGVVQQTQQNSDELEYVACVEVRPSAPVPPGMVDVTLGPTRYAKFAHRGRVALLDRTVSYIYSSWLARAEQRHTGGADLEVYGAEYHPVSEDSVIHYAIPVQR